MDRRRLWINVDNYKRRIFLKYEIKKLFLIGIRSSKKNTYLQKYKASFFLSNIPYNSNKNLLNNRCVVTGRNWSVNSKTDYSRFYFRDESYKGSLPGFKRASW